MSRYQLLWLCLYVFSALYSFCWDVLVDWGLGEPDSLPPALRSLLGGRARADAGGASAAAQKGLRGLDEAAAARASAQSSKAEYAAAAEGVPRALTAAAVPTLAELELGDAAAPGQLRARSTSAAAKLAAASTAVRAAPCALRQHLLYRVPAAYYAAMVTDLFGRFTFMYTLIPSNAGFNAVGAALHALTPFVAAIELLRRGMWSLFRLENQQLGNGPDRVSTTDSIPLHFDKPKEQAAPKERSSMRSLAGTLLEVGLFLAIAGGVLVVAICTRHVETDDEPQPPLPPGGALGPADAPQQPPHAWWG